MKLVRNPLVLNSQSVSDHDILVYNLDAIIEKQKPVFQTFRKIKNINQVIFKTTLLSSTIFSQRATTVDEYVEQIKDEVTKALDKVAQIQTKRKFCPKSTWLSPEAQDAKRNRRKLEKRWNATRDENIKVKYRQACRRANRLIVDSRKNHFASKIESASDNPKQQWSAIKNLLHPQGSKTVSRDKDASADFCKSISDFFNTKILDLKLAITDRLRGAPRTPMAWDIQHQGENLNKIQPATLPEVLKLISNMPGKLSPSGPPSENPGPWAERSRALIYRAVTDPKYNWQCWLWALPGPTGPLKVAGPLGICPPCPPLSAGLVAIGFRANFTHKVLCWHLCTNHLTPR